MDKMTTRESKAIRQAKGYCRICGRETSVCFNIELAKVSICDRCADSITVQQVTANMMERFTKR